MDYVKQYNERRKYLREHCKGVCYGCACEIDIGDNIWVFRDQVYCSAECVAEAVGAYRVDLYDDEYEQRLKDGN